MKIMRLGLALLVAYSIYSLHFIWLLNRTANECQQISTSHVDLKQLVEAQRVCSASGFDTTNMLKGIFAAK